MSKLKVYFSNAEIFNEVYKKMIIKYFIEKCKDNDKDTMKNYRDYKLWELFINSDNKQNLLIFSLINEDFDINHNFIELLPDELNDDEFDIISGLIYKIIEKMNLRFNL